MEMSGYLHDPAVLAPGKIQLCPLDRRLDPGASMANEEKKKFLTPQ
jgi:hypothetical protein